MISRMIPMGLVAALVLFGSACDPYGNPPSTSNPDTPAEAWRGTYTGRCLLTCTTVGAFEREMAATLHMNPAVDELNIQLFLVPDLAYSPKFRYTGPVASAGMISFHIEDDVFIYHAELSHTGDHIGGALWISDLQDHAHWTVICIEVDLE
jgi:hypothetical protein